MLAALGLTAALVTGLAAPAAAGTVPAAARPREPAAARPRETVFAWGANFYGELGNGTTIVNSPTPVAVKLPAGLRFTAVRCLLFCIAVTTTGKVYAWGDNSFGQLGDGTTKRRLTPVRVRLPAGVKVATARLGGNFVLALTTAGRLLAWGANSAGELGNGSTRSRRLPVRTRLPRGVRIKAVSAGGESGLALTTTGRVLSWGENTSGQLGTGTTKGRRTPGWVKLPKGTKATGVAAGPATGYAITAAGRLLAWGENTKGQLGDGTTISRKAPVRVRLPAGTKVTAVTSGLLHALALTTHGRVLAWGYNLNGQLGIGSMKDRHRPARVRLKKGVKVVALAAGKYYSMALTSSTAPTVTPAVVAQHTILAWGSNASGDLGTGSTADSDVPVTARLPLGAEPTGIGSGWGSGTSLAITYQDLI